MESCALSNTSKLHPTPLSGTLAVAMIARNEARCITRCLDSVRPWVDKMIVLDTGSTDDTKDLARRAGAIVHEMPWPDSFSKARNRSLELADADWNLIIDADEWLVSGGENLRAWCQSANQLGAICVHSLNQISNRSNGQVTPTATVNWLTRVLPRGARFERRIHEQVASPLPRARIELHLGHDGYLDAQLPQKQNRNSSLLLLDLKDHPGDPYILYQLGQEAARERKFATATKYLRKSLAASPKNANWLHGLVIRYLYCLSQTRDLNKALIYINKNSDRWSHSPDFFYVAGHIALQKAKADRKNALTEWVPLAKSAFNTCLEIGDRPHLEDSCQGVGGHLAQAQIDAIERQFELSPA